MAQTTPTRILPKVIVLSLLLYRCLLRMGPASFHRDFGALALQDFRQCCRSAYQQQGSLGVLRLWPGLLSETVSGLLAEYWTEFFGRRSPMLSTVRRSLVATFWAFTLFLFAWAALVRTADPVAPFDAVGRSYPEVAITYTLFAHSGAIALLATMLGGLPILFTVVKRALQNNPSSVLKLFLIKPKQALLLLGGALILVVCFVGYLLGTEYIFSSPTASWGSCPVAQQCLGQQAPGLLVLNLATSVGGLTLGIFAVLALSASLSLAVLRSEFGTGILRFALASIGILALTMATATVASTIWTIRLWVDAPQFAASRSGLGKIQTAWVIAIIIVMAISTGITAAAFTRSLRTSLFRAA
ncbi:hypothetical protein [Dictyobacter vulcani]|nr:hypothetical protein [Dictyobacter vulcani]